MNPFERKLEKQPLSPEQQEREEIWAAAERAVNRIADLLGKPIERGVKPLVVAFLANGFNTSGSCEGHLPREGLLNKLIAKTRSPYIDFQSPHPDHEKLYNIKKEIYRGIDWEHGKKASKKELEKMGELNKGMEPFEKVESDFVERIFREIINYANAGGRWEIHGIAHTERIQAVFSKRDKTLKMMTTRIAELKQRRRDMAKFAEYLRNHFFSNGPYTGRDFREFYPEKFWAAKK